MFEENSLMGQLESKGYIRNYVDRPGENMKTVTAQFTETIAGSRLKMPFDDILTNSRITCIDIINNTEVINNPHFTAESSGDFLPNLTNVQLADIFFVLGRNDEQLAIVPATTMVRNNNLGKRTFFNSIDHIWPDCYFEIATSGNILVNDVVTLEVWYQDKEEENE